LSENSSKKVSSSTLVVWRVFTFFEPIFFPKFQIYFADFPYLRYFIRLEAFHLGDLMRIIVRTNQKGKLKVYCYTLNSVPFDFQGSTWKHQIGKKTKKRYEIFFFSLTKKRKTQLSFFLLLLLFNRN